MLWKILYVENCEKTVKKHFEFKFLKNTFSTIFEKFSVDSGNFSTSSVGINYDIYTTIY